MTAPTELFDMNAAPMRIGTVRLKVRDLDLVSRFYREVLGLSEVDTGEGHVALGAGGLRLLELEGDARLAPRDPTQAGLFHTAFLLPTRADLGRWLAHAAGTSVSLAGASDHIVSEALYLSDPEGNGIEVYADRPAALWRSDTGSVRMATERLDLQDLLESAAGTAWSGFPEKGCVGHVHLQVGDTGTADRFYRDVLGFDIAARYPGASFYGSGGYHHQLAGNAWNSRRAGTRPDGMAGLDRIEIILRDTAGPDRIAARAASAGIPFEREAERIALRDPWGNMLMLAHPAGL